MLTRPVMRFLAASVVSFASLAQNALPPPAAKAMPFGASPLEEQAGVWSPEQLAIMRRLRDGALEDSYALKQLRFLTDNIGPRLSGSPQAQHAVEYVASEMKALGATVALEKTEVPHWVRGLETGHLVSWPNQTPNTTQKIVLTALGGSVATPDEGLTAEVVVVNSFAEAKQLPAGAAKGKLLLFNERFDKELAAMGNGGAAYGQAVAYRGAGPR